LIKGSENVYFSLESKNTASHNIGTWDRMIDIINQKTDPHHEPISPKPPIQIKKMFFLF